MSEKHRRRSIFDMLSENMEEFEELANELIDSVFPEGPSWNIDTCCLNALCTVFITPREVIITADLPNIDPQTVKVDALDENVFEIMAQMKKKVRFSDFGIFHREGEFSSLHCQVRIPVAINAEKMKTSLEVGILEVRFPRKGIYKINVE